MANRWIVPYSDGHIIKKIKKLLKQFPEISGSINIGVTQFEIAKIESTIANSVLSSDGNSIIHFSLHYGDRYISYSLNHGEKNNFAKIEDGAQSNAALGKEVEFFLSFFKEFPSKVGDLPIIDQDFVSGEFLKIQSSLSGAVEEFSKLQVSFLEKNQKLREQHEIEVDQLRSQISSEKESLQAEIAKQHEELAAARKLIDDRSNTHARRAIRTELKDSITDSLSQPSLATNTENQRSFVRRMYLISVIALCLLAAYSILLFSSAVSSNTTGAFWITGIKASISSVSAIGLVLLYLRWETQWLTQQANFERVLTSTKVDIDRASWVAESLLEWNRESQNKEIPSELLQSFTRRLFDWDGKVEDHQSAQDSLASAILGSAAKLQIGPNGANVEFDRKGITKLDKT